MTFWLYDPRSFKDSALFPTGGLGNFLNTLTLLLVGVIAAMKTKFSDISDNMSLIKYGSLALVLILGSGLLFCDKNEELEEATTYNFDLSFD
tara:strand:- start:1268 stop:1543 length:276 start_codon:yes stop_codon:yes gene_type:complete